LRPFEITSVSFCRNPSRRLQLNYHKEDKSMMTNSATLTKAQPPNRKFDLEVLFLDLNRCTRCLGTKTDLEAALQSVQQVLAVTGAAVDIHKILIDSPAKAQQYSFVTSPTLRVNGREIALPTKESACAATDSCGGQTSAACHVWDAQGAESTEVPVGMIVEAILQGVFGSAESSQPGVETSADVSANQQHPFATSKEQVVTGGTVALSACCGAEKQQSCCAPSAKATCCGAQAASGSCGCK
jgi:hypothetical protein